MGETYMYVSIRVRVARQELEIMNLNANEAVNANEGFRVARQELEIMNANEGFRMPTK